jgi:uncharacterized iron-regulated membrane protein
MMKTTLAQKNVAILAVLGIVVIVLAGVNRFLFDNTVLSVIVVTLSVVFFVTFVWFYITSRRAAAISQPKQTKQKPKK